MSGPLVTVLVPSYNHADFIHACLDSLRTQTYPSWHAIVVDDGSTDGTRDEVRSYGDDRVSLIERPHRGIAHLAELYNRGLAEARGAYVAVLEGDDLYPPDKLTIQVRDLEEGGAVLGYGQLGLVDDRGEEFARVRPAPRDPRVRDNRPVGHALRRLLYENFIPSQTVLLQTDALRRIGGFRQTADVPYVDLPTWLRLALEGRFVYTPRVTGYWRRHRGQYTFAAPERMATGPLARAFYEEARELFPGLEALVPEAALDRMAERSRVVSALFQGRARLLEGKWDEARAAFLRAVGSRWPPGAAVGLLGLAASVLHWDLEWAFRWAGRYAWK